MYTPKTPVLDVFARQSDRENSPSSFNYAGVSSVMDIP
jgi:hypothetical protein